MAESNQEDLIEDRFYISNLQRTLHEARLATVAAPGANRQGNTGDPVLECVNSFVDLKERCDELVAMALRKYETNASAASGDALRRSVLLMNVADRFYGTMHKEWALTRRYLTAQENAADSPRSPENPEPQDDSEEIEEENVAPEIPGTSGSNRDSDSSSETDDTENEPPTIDGNSDQQPSSDETEV